MRLFTKFGNNSFYFGATVLFSAITLLAVFVHFSPGMPCPGLDCSWIFAMNQALGQHLLIGRDIIFTFGPYSSIYTNMFSPYTDRLMLFSTTYLALSYLLVLSIVLRRNPTWMIVYCIFLATIKYTQSIDVLLFSLPLLSCIAIDSLSNNEHSPLIGWQGFFYTFALFAPLGLLPLIKGTLIILCLTAVAGSSLYLYINRRKSLSLSIFLFPIASCIIFWLLSGQNISGFPSFFLSMRPIIAGYSAAMSSSSPHRREIVFYLVASVSLVLPIMLNISYSLRRRIFLGTAYFIFLFLSFKEAFVRHDDHALVAALAIMLAAILLPAVTNRNLLFWPLFLSICSFTYTDSNYASTSTSSIIGNLINTYPESFNGLRHRLYRDNNLPIGYALAVSKIKADSRIPHLKGSTDLYSYNQSELILSGNQWDPRPVFQSYFAYTKSLADLNRSHLLGAHAPDNVIFRVEPIDNRLPSLEDGPSWPVLLEKYAPTSYDNGFLVLKNLGPNRVVLNATEITQKTAKIGERIILPTNSNPIFAEINIKPSMIGHIISLIYKPSELNIEVTLANGLIRNYRYISGMGEGGFIISPLVEDTSDFANLYIRGLGGKRVKSIRISSLGNFKDWKRVFTIKFSSLKNVQSADPEVIYHDLAHPIEMSTLLVAMKCDGSIDVVNGTNPAPQRAKVSNILSVSGWLATSIKAGTIPDKTFITLIGSDGQHLLFPTIKSLRPDVGTYFKNPVLDNSGYTTIADISKLHGYYRLGLAYQNGATEELCPQFNIPVMIP